VYLHELLVCIFFSFDVLFSFIFETIEMIETIEIQSQQAIVAQLI